MVTFVDACEIASCHFGEVAGTSCLGGAWDTREYWIFEPDRSLSHMLSRYRIAVYKNSGATRHVYGGWGDDMSAQLPWRYLTKERAGELGVVHEAGAVA